MKLAGEGATYFSYTGPRVEAIQKSQLGVKQKNVI
jgi:hypothetical protein